MKDFTSRHEQTLKDLTSQQEQTLKDLTSRQEHLETRMNSTDLRLSASTWHSDRLSTLWLAGQPSASTQLEGIHAPTCMPTVASSPALATMTLATVNQQSLSPSIVSTHTPLLPNPRPSYLARFPPFDKDVYQPLLRERNYI